MGVLIMRLYEIANEYLNAFDSLSEIDGLDNEIIENTLSPITHDINKKSINIASYIKNLESDINEMEKYINKMQNKKKSIQNKINSIKEYLRFNMERCGITEITSPEFKIKLGAEDIRTEIYDSSLLSMNFCKVVQKIEPDKMLMKQAILNGKEIEGVRLIRIRRLTIS